MSRYVLDIGAGARPIQGATHAIDIASKEEILEERAFQNLRGLPKRLRYTFNHDIIRQALPYPSNFFNSVVSRYTLGRFGLTAHPWREAYRVLKPGGVLTLDLGEIDPESLEIIRALTKSIGFSSGKLQDLGDDEIRAVLRK